MPNHPMAKPRKEQLPNFMPTRHQVNPYPPFIKDRDFRLRRLNNILNDKQLPHRTRMMR